MSIDEIKISTTEHDALAERFAPVLRECDPDAIDGLAYEIDNLRTEGFEVSIGESNDEAYNHPDEIRRVFSELEVVNDAVESVQRDQTFNWVGYIATAPHKWPQRNREIKKQQYNQQDTVRSELLYGPGATDSQAWHDQRGRAPALLSITSGHELIPGSRPAIGGEVYSTLSGPLDETIFDYQFPENMQYIGGANLSEALRIAEMTHSGIKASVATIKSEKRLAKLNDFIRSPNSASFIDIAKYCTDSLGIRSRMHEMGETIELHLLELHESGVDLDDEHIISVGSGTALSVLQVMQRLRGLVGSCPTAVLVDQDPVSLAAAVQLAEKMGLADKIEIHCERLFSKTGIPLKLDNILGGREVVLSEDAGLREYLPDRLYKSLGGELWSSLKEGGMMATANMNKNRPQKRFLHGGMGWQPDVQMRSIAECLALHGSTGVNPDQLSAQVTHDGVYTAYYSVK